MLKKEATKTTTTTTKIAKKYAWSTHRVIRSQLNGWRGHFWHTVGYNVE